MGGGSYRLKSIRKTALIFLLIITLISVILINKSEAKYQVGKTYEDIVSGNVKNNIADFSLVSIYIDGEKSKDNQIPNGDYEIDEEISNCKVNDEEIMDITFKYQDGKVGVYGITKSNTKCNLYFIKKKTATEVIAKLGLTSKGVIDTQITGPSCKESSENCGGTGNYNMKQNDLYESVDDDGVTYYFRGSVENNYLNFAGYSWRIIRINGDGSIRIIYDGKTPHKNGEVTTDSIVFANQKWNIQEENISDNNMYVGLTWKEGQVRGYEAKSNALQQLEKWYISNLQDYEKYIDKDAGFCSDRQPSSITNKINNQGGISQIVTYYGAYTRLSGQGTNPGTVKQYPTFKCSDETNQKNEDLYTVKTSNKGNHALDYPIGFITADEAAYAGGYGSNAVAQIINSSYYLYNGQHYYTMSPLLYSSNNTAIVYRINSNGSLNYVNVNDNAGIRPVINLKSSLVFTGQGTYDNPYVVVTDK